MTRPAFLTNARNMGVATTSPATFADVAWDRYRQTYVWAHRTEQEQGRLAATLFINRAAPIWRRQRAYGAAIEAVRLAAHMRKTYAHR